MLSVRKEELKELPKRTVLLVRLDKSDMWQYGQLDFVLFFIPVETSHFLTNHPDRIDQQSFYDPFVFIINNK